MDKEVDVVKERIRNVIEEFYKCRWKYLEPYDIGFPGVQNDLAIRIVNSIIPEGSVVLTKEKLVKERERAVEYYKALTGEDTIRKETARDILKLIDPKCEICDAKWHEGCHCVRNQRTKEKEAFETIIFQNRDNGYISDAYRNDIDVVCKGLNILHALQNKLENNTLYRVFPFETAKAIETYLKNDEDIKEWLER